MNASATLPVSRRSPRDWVVDTGLFLLAATFWVLAVGGRMQAAFPPEPSWVFALDAVASALGTAALWWRRRWPVGLAVVLVALSAFSELVAAAMVVGLFTVVVHRPPRTTAVVFALSLLAALVYVVVRPEPGVPNFLLLLLGVAVQGAAVGWGLFIRHRRQLALSLRERAAAAETGARLRAEQAQHRARGEIAREMHDVLGHRLSLLSVHAGALEYHPDAPAEEVARAARVVRESATRRCRTCARSSACCAPRSASCPSPPWPTCSCWSPSRPGPGCGWTCAPRSAARRPTAWAAPPTGSCRRR
jgi:signal transduction histidine kinase